MTQRDKDQVKVLINEAKVWAESNKDYLTGLDNDCEEISIPCLTIEEVKRLLENLKLKLLKDDDPNEGCDHLKECPCCHGHNVEAHSNPGDWGYYPASAYIECKDCGTRSREYDGKDDTDQKGAILKATIAWNRRNS